MAKVSSRDEKKNVKKGQRRHFENFERFTTKICSVKKCFV
jgi:hypothetical protein